MQAAADHRKLLLLLERLGVEAVPVAKKKGMYKVWRCEKIYYYTFVCNRSIHYAKTHETKTKY
jgi:hypothetical protein